MKTVQIINGSYGADNGKGGVTVINCGQICQVDDTEAMRLIALKVAVTAVATRQEDAAELETGRNTADDNDAQEGVTGHLDAEQLLTMTNAQLKQLAEDMGLDTSKCRKKSDYIDLITAEDVFVTPDEADDGETMPDLIAEEPVT